MFYKGIILVCLCFSRISYADAFSTFQHDSIPHDFNYGGALNKQPLNSSSANAGNSTYTTEHVGAALIGGFIGFGVINILQKTHRDCNDEPDPGYCRELDTAIAAVIGIPIGVTFGITLMNIYYDNKVTFQYRF